MRRNAFQKCYRLLQQYPRSKKRHPAQLNGDDRSSHPGPGRHHKESRFHIIIKANLARIVLWTRGQVIKSLFCGLKLSIKFKLLTQWGNRFTYTSDFVRIAKTLYMYIGQLACRTGGLAGQIAKRDTRARSARRKKRFAKRLTGSKEGKEGSSASESPIHTYNLDFPS